MTTQPNLALAIQEWLQHKLQEGTELPGIIERAIGIEAGNACLTNRFYVGNGGSRIPYFIFNFIFRELRLSNKRNDPGIKKRSDFAERLIYKIVLQSGEDIAFIQHFIYDLGSSYKDYRNNEKNEQEHRLLRFYTYYFLFQSQPYFQSFHAYHSDPYETERSITNLIEIAFCFDMLRKDLLAYANGSKAVFSIHLDHARFDSILAKNSIHHIIGMMLSFPTNRKTIRNALKRSKWLRKQFLAFPASIFRIAREKDILKVFLQKEKRTLRSLRDESGNDLVTYVLGLKGKTDNNIKLLKEFGLMDDPSKTK